ncbi:hypothetical protein [Aquirufa nivalisilvae]
MKDSQNDNFGSSNIPQEKKNWVSPELNVWASDNIGAYPGGIVDGGAQSYIP